MTQTQKTFLLLLLLALGGGVGALWFLGLGEPESNGVVSYSNQAPTEPAPAPSNTTDRTGLETADEPVDPTFDVGETTVAFPLQVRLTQLRHAMFGDVKGIDAIGSGAAARIKGLVNGTKGEGVRASLEVVAGPNTGRTLECDATGVFGATDLYPGLALVRIVTPSGRVAEREVRLANSQTARLNIGFGRPTVVYGQVVDKAGEPIVAVAVNMDGQETFTDDLGEFRFPQMTCGDLVLATFRKPGYALYREMLGITAGTTIPKGRLSFRLDPEAKLEVSIQGNLGSAGEPAHLYFFPLSGQRVNGSRGQRTYPWHLLGPIEIYPGGSKLIEGLPEGHVQLVAFRSGAAANPPFINTKLYAGRTVQQVIRLQPAPQVQGRVVRAGKPVSGARVTLEAPNRLAATSGTLQRSSYHQEMLMPLLPSGLQVAHTDAAGRFWFTAFAEVASGSYLTAETSDGLWRGTHVVEKGEIEGIDVELERASQLVGHLTLGLTARFQGLPVRIFVGGSPRDPLIVPPDEDELTIEELGTGTWRLDVEWDREPLLEGLVVEVTQDGKPILVTLPEGAVDGQTAEERRRSGH